MIRAVLALLFAALALSGCEAPRAPAQTQGKPALWAIERANGEAAGWLFGTIHALPREAKWTTPALDRAFDASDVLVVEVRDLDPQAIAPVFAELNRDCPCPPLPARVGAADRAPLASLLEDAGMRAGQFDGFETWAAVLALAATESPADLRYGADQALLARAGTKPVAELEGARAQLAIFDRLPENAQRAMLREVVRAHAGAEREAERLAEAWLAGDLATLEAETRRGMLADPALYEALLKSRNAVWMDKLTPMLANDKRPFIAVGAAHLVGKDGLVSLLVAKGYKLRRLQ